MDMSYEALAGFAKSFGLFYLIGLSVAVTAYAYWPSLGPRFDRAASSVLDDEDGPRSPAGPAAGDAPWR